MKPNELRIGNYIFSKETNSIQKITGLTDENPFIDAVTFDYTTYDEIEGIELTEDILYKLGFVKDGIWFNFSFGFYGIGISKDPSGFHFSYYDGFIPIKFVHELQNLIFSLSNEELIFSDYAVL